MHSLRDVGVACSNYFPCIHLEPFYRDRWGFRAGDFPIAESISARTIALPFYGALSDDDIDHIAAQLYNAVTAL
jgi:perosamine synthetase